MIIKPSTKAAECEALKAFIESPDFKGLPEKTRRQVLNRQRGLQGERSTAHILDRHFHDAPNHALLHDLRLPDGIGGFAQFDHVILSRLSRTASIVEVKNYSGRLSKNQHDEWHVWYEGRRRPVDIPNPIAQARRQKDVLRSWLKAHKHDMAFEQIGAFVIVPPQCSIDRSKIGSDAAIYKADNFIAEWVDFGGVTVFGKMFSTGVSTNMLYKIAEQLSKSDEPDARSFEEKVGIATAIAIDPSLGEIAVAQTPAGASDSNPSEESVSPTDQAEEHASIDDDQEIAEASDIIPISVPDEEVTNAPQGHCVPSKSQAAGDADEPDPAQTSELKKTTTRKAGGLVPVCEGISERELPDQRVAFVADKENMEARKRLTAACRGKGQWKPLFNNWVCDASMADEVRSLLQSN